MCTQTLIWLSCGHATLTPIFPCAQNLHLGTCTIIISGDHRIIEPRMCEMCELGMRMTGEEVPAATTTARPMQGSVIAGLIEGNKQMEREIEEMMGMVDGFFEEGDNRNVAAAAVTVGEAREGNRDCGYGLDTTIVAGARGGEIDWTQIFRLDEATLPAPAPDILPPSRGVDADALLLQNNGTADSKGSNGSSSSSSNNSATTIQGGGIPVEMEDILRTEFGGGFDLKDEMDDF